MTELKPCPFCGSVNVSLYTAIGWTGDTAHVVCIDCGASSKMIFNYSVETAKKKAVRNWNRRAK